MAKNVGLQLNSLNFGVCWCGREVNLVWKVVQARRSHQQHGNLVKTSSSDRKSDKIRLAHVEIILFIYFKFQPVTAAAPAKGASKDKTKNIMRDLKIRKLCLNICVGESGDRLTRAAKVWKERLTNNKNRNAHEFFLRFRCWNSLPANSPCTQKPVTPCDPSESVVMKRSPFTAPFVALKPRRFSRKASRWVQVTASRRWHILPYQQWADASH